MKKRVKFKDIFKINKDGTLTTRKTIQISSLKISENVHIGHSVSIGGIDLLNYIGHDLQVIQKKDYCILTDIY